MQFQAKVSPSLVVSRIFRSHRTVIFLFLSWKGRTEEDGFSVLELVDLHFNIGNSYLFIFPRYQLFCGTQAKRSYFFSLQTRTRIGLYSGKQHQAAKHKETCLHLADQTWWGKRKQIRLLPVPMAGASAPKGKLS